MPVPAIRASSLGKRYRIATARPAARGAGGLLTRLGWRTATTRSDVWALRDAEFQVAPGEVLGVIGRNGAGKSTLLKILARVTDPTSGRAVVNGRVGSLLEVGTGFHPELSGRDNIYLNGAILGMTRAEIRTRFDEIVAFAEIDRFLDTPVKRYSSGMYVRLAFAVAAHLEPEILLVDEVLAVGDAGFQRKCLGKMSEASRGGRTILFVSHNLAAVEGLCRRGLVLEAGRIVFDGPVKDALQRYLSVHPGPAIEPLAERRDRSGSGVLRFTNLRLRDADGGALTCLTTGRDAMLDLEYVCHAARPLRQPEISIGIDSNLGQRIAHLSSAASGDAPAIAPGAGRIRVSLPHLALLPGRYHYTLFCRVGGDVADWVQNAGAFDVESGDFYQSGRLPPSGFVCLDCRFAEEALACS